MPDAVAFLASGAVFVALLAVAEVLHQRWKVEPELARKFAHVSSGLVAASLPLFLPFLAVALLALLFVPFMLVSRQLDLFPAVHQVERSTLGEMYFPLGVMTAALAFPHRGPFAFGVLVMGISDAAAGIAGERYGHRAYRILTAWKTYVGSGVFLATTVLLIGAALALTSGFDLASVPLAIGLAVALTGVEAALGGGADNLVLPVVAAGLLTLAT